MLQIFLSSHPQGFHQIIFPDTTNDTLALFNTKAAIVQAQLLHNFCSCLQHVGGRQDKSIKDKFIFFRVSEL